LLDFCDHFLDTREAAQADRTLAPSIQYFDEITFRQTCPPIIFKLGPLSSLLVFSEVLLKQ
jgi:hypothetical protein